MALVDSTQQLLQAAMRGSWQRETALTNNIANADTPGYQPQEVSFESALTSAMNSGESPSEVQFQTETKPLEAGPNGTGISVDQESAKLAENGLDYQALTQVLGARNDILRSAMGAAALMGLFDAIGIAGSGLTAERIRMDVTAENLANADTTKAANGQPYQRQEVELAQVGSQASDFGGALSSAIQRSGGAQPAGGVEVTGIVSDSTPDQQVYDPGSPEADAQGYVKMPNISTVTEMTDLISESQSYQSDVTAMQTSKSMFTSTLGLLK